MAETKIFTIDNPKAIDDFRQLLWDYGASRQFDAALVGYREELDQLPGKYGPPGGCGLIAYHGAEAAACIAYRQLDEKVCEMKRLYVSPPFRGLGIGRKLVARLLAEARTHPYQLMRLDTHPTMTAAQNLYRQFGFQETDPYNNNPIKGIRFFELQL